MIKIAEIWGQSFDIVASELEQTTEGVSEIVLDFLNEVRYVLDRPSYNKILEIAKQKNIPITILTPYLREMPPLMEYSDNVKIIHWETFWFNRTYKSWSYHDDYNKQKNLEMFNPRNGEFLNDFKFPYITLNNIAKYHRCLVMDLLAKHNLIDTGAIAWRDILRSCDDIRHTFPEGMTDSMYMKYPYRYWKPKRLILDQNIDDKFNQETLPIEFNQSFMQLVTESDEEVVFFSEKTATPILLNKPFLVASCSGHHTALLNRGFALYDEIFDYSFDNESDINIRYDGLIENIKRLHSMDLNKAYKRIFEKLVYNKQRAIELMTNVPTEVLSLLERIRAENKEPYSGPLNMLL